MIGERTRDKMCAARRKGKWVGGYPALGYDIAPGGGKLIVNPHEAERVRAIFELFHQTGSIADTLTEIERRGKKSLKRLRTSVYELLRPHDTRPWELVRADLNARLRGWQNYFSYGAVARPYATVNRYVYDRVRYFLRRRHTTTHSRGTRQFSDDVVFGRLRVYSLRPH